MGVMKRRWDDNAEKLRIGPVVRDFFAKVLIELVDKS